MYNSRFSIVTDYFIPTEAIQKNPAFKYPTNTGRSEVWRCFMTLPEQSKNLCVAVKSITFRNPTEDEIKKAKKVILHQASIWIELYHDNILRLEGIINDGFGPLPALVSPWMENGSLDEYLKLRQLDLNKKLFMLREVAAGLQYLHSNSIYSDLTPADILIDGDGKPYLRGFGVWMVIAGSDATTFQSECKDKYRWMARERFGISEEEPTQTGEVYSYGCIMIMLLSGHRPYHWHSEQDSFDIIVARIDDKEPFKQFGDLDNEPKLKQLAQQCLLESGQRPSLSCITDLLRRRINISNAMIELLSNLQINQIPKAALLTCDSNDCSNIGRALKYNWLHGSNATVVAVKTLDVGDLNDIDIDKTCNMIRREVYIRERLKHETILDLYGMTTGFGILPSFVYPWMVHGSLHDYLEREFFTLFPHNKLNILYQLADGIKYLHKNNIAHGNLTGDSVLLGDAGRVRIADFSRSVILGDGGDGRPSKRVHGAARYISPESVVCSEQAEPQQPTKSHDVYSYGCIMILVFSGKVPYWWISEESKIKSEKVKGTEPFLPTLEIDQVHLDLARRCLSMSIESRPVIEDVLYSVQHIDVVDLTQSVLRLDEYPIAGGFSEVYRCRLALTSVDVSVRRAISHYGLPSTTTSVDVAVKKARKRMNDATDMKVIDRSFREIKIWMRLEHENIVPIWGVTDGFGSVPALVMPWLENGALTGYIQREHRALSHSQKFTLLRDVARGLQYLHSQSTIHGDLSGNNVLVDQDGKASLSDFGLSLFLPEILSEALVPTNLYGTIAYMPPEYLTSDDDDNPPLVHSTASDVYSFGGIMLLVLEGKPPYYYIRSMMRIMMMKSRGMTPRRPSESVMSDSEWNFLRSCWSEDMDKRPLDCEILAFVEERLEPRYS